MKILLIHEHGRSHGSGGVIALYRLHRTLQKLGVQSTVACRRKEIDGDDFVQLPRSDFIENLIAPLTWRLGLNEIHCVSSFKIPRFKPFLDADVVNIHGLHTNFFNYLALPAISRAKPTVITLHDMWPLTGHCATSFECTRWKHGCGNCPHLDVFPPVSRDATAIEWRLKKHMYQRATLHIVSPSRWLASIAEQSILGHFPIHHIPNALDTDVYRPLNKENCKKGLGIPEDKSVIMFAAAALNIPAKGSHLLIRALQKLPKDVKSKLVMLLLGDKPDSVADQFGMPVISLGYVLEEEKKVRAYCAADVFVLPSRAENHSLVLLEAQSCGTPCVAFDVGGNAEIIRHEETGLIAALDDDQELSAALARLLSDKTLHSNCSHNAREIAEREYSLDLHANRYIDLYKSSIVNRQS